MVLKSQVVPRTQDSVKMGIRSRKEIRAKVDPIESESWSWGKMITCWEQRDKQCFWENFMWWLDQQQTSTKYTIPYNTPWQPDQQAEPGSPTRCITSDQPKYKWWASINGEVPNLFSRQLKDIPNFRCTDIPAGQNFLQADCRSKCGRLKDNSEYCSGRNSAEMEFEQTGCDGATAYCWCNSDPTYQNI